MFSEKCKCWIGRKTNGIRFIYWCIAEQPQRRIYSLWVFLNFKHWIGCLNFTCELNEIVFCLFVKLAEVSNHHIQIIISRLDIHMGHHQLNMVHHRVNMGRHHIAMVCHRRIIHTDLLHIHRFNGQLMFTIMVRHHKNFPSFIMFRAPLEMNIGFLINLNSNWIFSPSEKFLSNWSFSRKSLNSLHSFAYYFSCHDYKPNHWMLSKC